MSEFDLAAANIRQGMRDEKAFVAALAIRLERALLNRVSVKYAFSLFKKERQVSSITVRLVEHEFILNYHHAKGVTTHIGQFVRGIRLNQTSVNIDQWLKHLTQHLGNFSEQSGEGFAELEKFLMS